MAKLMASLIGFTALILNPLAHADSLIDLAVRSSASATAFHDMQTVSNTAIPQNLLDRAICIATIPQLVHHGLIFGAKLGTGLVSCKTDGSWSAPAVIRLVGGSWATPPGAQSVDVVLIFTRANAVSQISRGSAVLIGRDVSVAGGPQGSQAVAGVDFQLTSDIYSYVRAGGVASSASVAGSSLQAYADDNHLLYGTGLSLSAILRTPYSGVPEELGSYVQALSAN
jgi:lipid-binding SYLF domain-containing protein